MKTILPCSSPPSPPPNNFYRVSCFLLLQSPRYHVVLLPCRSDPTLKHPGDVAWLKTDGAISRDFKKKHSIYMEQTNTETTLTMIKKTEASPKHPMWGTWLVIEVNHKQQSAIKLQRNRFCTDTEEAGTWETAPKHVQVVGTAFLEITCQKAILTVSTHIIYVLNLI